MTPRFDVSKYLNSGLLRAMLNLGREVEATGLDKTLYELVKIRASQINGCAYCIDMHTKDARAHGESEQRIYALNAWRETKQAEYVGDFRQAVLWRREGVTLSAVPGSTR